MDKLSIATVYEKGVFMKIQEVRIKAGLSQKKMSELTSIPLRTIENWETGQRKPPEYVKNFVVDYLKRFVQIQKIKGAKSFNYKKLSSKTH